MRAPALALALVAACSGAAPRASPAARASRTVERAPPPGWTRVAPRRRPSRIDDVVVLADGSLAVRSASAVHRLDDAGETATACALDPNVEAGGLQAAGPTWWLVAGDAFEASVYRGGDGIEGCTREALPPLVTRDAPAGELRATQSGDEAIVWSSAGAMARSRGGHAWQRVPPLPEVVAVTVSGGSLYAAALLGGAGSRSLFDRRGYDLFVLREGDARWSLAAPAGDRAAPVALFPREGGGVAGVDVLGGFAVTAEGAASVSPVTGPHFARDRPRLLFATTPGVAVGLAEGMLLEFGLAGWRPLPPIPDDHPPTAFAAAPDGSVVVTDGRELWRLRRGAAPVAVLRSPFGGERPSRLAVAGPVLAAASTRARVSISRDGGATWTTATLPPGAGAVRSLTVLPGGAVAAVSDGTSPAPTEAAPVPSLWIFDPGVHRLDLPRGARVVEAGAALHVVGDRWILAAGDVFVSDDQGATWRPTLRAPAGRAEAWGVVALATAPAARAVYALDGDGGLWRSDEVGDAFASIAPAPAAEPSGRGALAFGVPTVRSDWLRWDGGDALLASVGRQLYRYDRDGRGGPVGSLRGVVFAAPVDGGAVLAVSAATAPAGDCPPDDAALLLTLAAGSSPSPVDDVCAHGAVVFALDGDALYTADADGAIERASLRGLWSEGGRRRGP